jgi:hypothetical protein
MIKNHALLSTANASTKIIPRDNFFFSRVLRFEAINPRIHVSHVNNLLHLAEFTVAMTTEKQEQKSLSSLDVIPNMPEHTNNVNYYEFELAPGNYLPSEIVKDLNEKLIDRDVRFEFVNGFFSVTSQNKNSIEIICGEHFLDSLDTGGRTITRSLGFVDDIALSAGETKVAHRTPRCPYAGDPWFDSIDERQFNRTFNLIPSLRAQRGNLLTILLTTDKQGKKVADAIHVRLGAPGMPAVGYCAHEMYIPRKTNRISIEAYENGEKFEGIANLQIGFVYRGHNNNSRKNFINSKK